jgi:hypothetical protein
VILFCPNCNKGIEQTGEVNRATCFQCKKSYIIKIELVEIENIRKSSSTGDSKRSLSEPGDPAIYCAYGSDESG